MTTKHKDIILWFFITNALILVMITLFARGMHFEGGAFIIPGFLALSKFGHVVFDI